MQSQISHKTITNANKSDNQIIANIIGRTNSQTIANIVNKGMNNIKLKKIYFYEKYHDNCLDYLKIYYIQLYASPKYKLLLYEIRQKIPIIYICSYAPPLNYANIVVCDQHSVIFGYYLDKFSILATYALNACIGLVMYLPKFKVASVAHFDGLPGYSLKSALDDDIHIDFDPVHKNITIILEKLRYLAKNKDKIHIDYYLIGGIFGLSEVMINDIISCINNIQKQNKIYTFRFAGRNLLGPINQARNICIDTRTGIISHFDYIANYEHYANRSKLLKYSDHGKSNSEKSDNTLLNNYSLHILPANIIKAPRKSEALLDITYMPEI